MHWMIHEYLGLTVREKRSFLIILILLSGSIMVRIWISKTEPAPIDLSDEQLREIESFVNSFEQIPKTNNEYPVTTPKFSEVKLEPMDFDPNTVSLIDLKRMGLDNFLAANIIRYREAGGIFKNPQDLAKIYGMDQDLFTSLKPFIIFAEKVPLQTITSINEPELKIEKLINTELNTAGIRDLLKIEGMAPEVAGRIIRYRELLGGFVFHDQLREVYGLSDTIRIRLTEEFTINEAVIQKISLKTASFSDLLRHPYLEKSHVTELFKIIEFYADSIHFRHLMENHALPDSVLHRIKPYILE